MRQAVGILVALLLVTPLAAGHLFNHYNQEVTCQTDLSPHGHHDTDGHKHAHNTTLAAAKGYVDHDPCKQTRMAYPDYHNATPLTEAIPPSVEIPLNQTLLPDGHTNHTHVFAGGEAYTLPIKPSKVKVQTDLVISSDLQAAGMGFPGTGEFDDPYVIEGYVINGGNLVIKDTSKCFDIRNNVIVSRAAVAPILPDPPSTSIINLTALVPYWQQINQTAHNLREHYTNLSRVMEDLNAVWEGNKTVKALAMEALNRTLGHWFENETLWEQRFATYETTLLGAIEQTHALADEFQGYARDYQIDIGQPPRDHNEFIDWTDREVLDRVALRPAFEAYQEDLQNVNDVNSVEGWIAGNPPPQDPPPGWTPSDWERQKRNYAVYQQDLQDLIANYWANVDANKPDEVAHQQFLDGFAAFLVTYNAEFDAYKAFLADYKAFKAERAAFQLEFSKVWADTGKQIADAKAFFEKQAQYLFEYAGTLGKYLYNTADQLLKWVLSILFGILDPEDPNNAARNTGQLILDWNGQCIHAHNNVASDLRVNQNNDRRGFATGGTIERNRFFTIGQIRHYDGIFRDNEVGNRAIAVNLLKPSIVPLVGTERAVANDGFNQGWFFDNVIYGAFDSTLHGHHHAAGFFAPLSHYHGSDVSKERMYANGVCTARYSDVNATRAHGPAKDYPRDSGIEVLGVELTQSPSNANQCIHHFDHGKRWTTLFFNDNVVIDPNGLGVRVNDRAHRANDEDANSENVDDLKAPHYHQKWWQVENNTVVGKIFIDRVNAPGTLLWSDNWDEVESPAGPDRILEALDHPGAEIVTSHPYRNDIWVDVQRNHVFATQSTGILVDDGDMLTLLQLKGNRVFGMPSGFNNNGQGNASFTRATFVDWLRNVENRTADSVHGDLVAWKGADRGTQAFASLSFFRNGYRVEHCANVARGLDVGLRANDRLYLEEGSGVFHVGQEDGPCALNDWTGTNPQVALGYTTPPPAPERCFEDLRALTADTDDYYATEMLHDVIEATSPGVVCETLFPEEEPSAAAAPATPSTPATPTVISGGAPA